MTDRIDLDERTDDEQADPDGHSDDWIWRDDATPTEAVESSSDSAPDSPSGSTATSSGSGIESDTESGIDRDDTESGIGPDTESDTESGSESSRSIPHVPHPDKGKPAGIPVEGGGSGGGTSTSGANTAAGDPGGDAETVDPDDVAASGPHGGGADDMTMAFTFDAIQRVSNPAAVLADAAGWTDWIGIVGDVDAHVINKFQRDHNLDVDFFNGTGTGPGERLAEIGPHSMFYADRMLVVGLEGRAEEIAAEADWEFVSLETAAEKAAWRLTEG